MNSNSKPSPNVNKISSGYASKPSSMMPASSKISAAIGKSGPKATAPQIRSRVDISKRNTSSQNNRNVNAY